MIGLPSDHVLPDDKELLPIIQVCGGSWCSRTTRSCCPSSRCVGGKGVGQEQAAAHHQGVGWCGAAGRCRPPPKVVGWCGAAAMCRPPPGVRICCGWRGRHQHSSCHGLCLVCAHPARLGGSEARQLHAHRPKPQALPTWTLGAGVRGRPGGLLPGLCQRVREAGGAGRAVMMLTGLCSGQAVHVLHLALPIQICRYPTNQLCSREGG